MNFGLHATYNRFSTSCSSNFESGVARYVEAESTVPSFFTEQENMTAPSFCPFRARSAVSMRLISESAPEPRRIGRYIGRLAAFDEPTSTWASPTLASDRKIMLKTARTRMGQIRNCNRENFQPQ